jgi:hypothetical protein
LGRRLDARHDAALALPGAGGIVEGGEAADLLRLAFDAPHGGVLGMIGDACQQDPVSGQPDT